MGFDGVNDELYLMVRNWDHAPPVWGNVDAISMTNDTVVSTLPIGQGFPLPEVAVDQRTGRVYVDITRYNNTSVGPDEVLGLSPQTNTIISNWSIPSQVLGFIADSSNGDLYILSGANNGTVFIINESSGQVVSTIPGNPYPTLAAFDPRNGNVYVAYEDSNTVSVVSGTSNEVISSVALPETPQWIAVDNATGNVFVGTAQYNETSRVYNHGNVTAIGGASNEVLSTLAFGDNFAWYVGDTLYGTILCQASGLMYVLNATTAQVRETVQEGLNVGWPGFVALDTVTGQVYITDWESGTVLVWEGIPQPLPAEMFLGLPLAVGLAVATQISTVAALAATVLLFRSKRRPH